MLYSALLLRVGCLLQAAQYTRVKWVIHPGIEKVETCHCQIKPCIVAIAMQNSSSLLVSKNFMRAADSRIPPVVVLSAGLHASSLVVDTITVAGAVAAVIAS